MPVKEFVNNLGRKEKGERKKKKKKRQHSSVPWSVFLFPPLQSIALPVYVNACSHTKNLGRYRFFSGIVRGKLSLRNSQQQQKVGNSTMFFAFCIRIDEGRDSLSEKACTKGKRKLHSPHKQIIMVLKALPYGPSTQALLTPQVCLCRRRTSSPRSAALHTLCAFSTPALTQVFPKCNSSKSKNKQNWASCSSINQYIIVNWNYFHLGLVRQATWAISAGSTVWHRHKAHLDTTECRIQCSQGTDLWYSLHNLSVPLGKHSSTFDHVSMQVNRDRVKRSYGKKQQQMCNMKMSIDTKVAFSQRECAIDTRKAT